MSLTEESFYASSYLYDLACKTNPKLNIDCDHWGRLLLGPNAVWGTGRTGDEILTDIYGNIHGVRIRDNSAKDSVLGIDGKPLANADKILDYKDLMRIMNAKDGDQAQEKICRTWQELNNIAKSSGIIILTNEKLREYGFSSPYLLLSSDLPEIEVISALLVACADYYDQFGWSEQMADSVKKRYKPLVKDLSILNRFRDMKSDTFLRHFVNPMRTPSRINTGVNCPISGCVGEIFQHIQARGKITSYCSLSPDCSFFELNVNVVKK